MKDNCDYISPECTIGDTVYGYYPSLGGNALYAAIFGICALAQVALGIKYRPRLYYTLVCLGCAGELLGYVGRMLLHNNPWNKTGLIINILALMVSPSFLAAAFYITLKQLVLYYGPEHSILKPGFYSWLFICCDALGFVTQMVGGVMTASDNTNTKKMGTDIMIGGLSFQAVTMAVAALLAVEFARRVYKHGAPRHISSKSSRAVKFYTYANVTAYLAVLARCIYRIPEIAGGWGNKMMRNEVEFMIFDGAMIALASILMTVANPGTFAPHVGKQQIQKSDFGLEEMRRA